MAIFSKTFSCKKKSGEIVEKNLQCLDNRREKQYNEGVTSTKEAYEMQEAMIRLNTVQDIRVFVETVTMTDVEVDLCSQRYIVDGKSIMGIYSLDLLNPIKMIVHSDDCPELMEKLSRFIIKE